MSNPYISQVTLPSGSVYDLKDQGARDLIAALNNWEYVVSTNAATTPYGVTWDSGGTTITGTLVASASTMYKIYLVPATINDNDAFAEYITIKISGSTYQWEQFGNLTPPDLSNYVSKDEAGALAYKNSASGTVTDYVTGGSGSFTGTAATLKMTPAGSVSLTNTNKTATVSKASSGTATYTPEGTNASSSVSGSCSVTATGSVSTPTISVKTAGSTTTVNSITSVGTLPSATMPTYTVANEVLTITAGSFSAGTLPTKGADTTVKTGDAAYQSSQPTFTGSAATGTISGTAAAQEFTGTGARLVTGNISVPSSASFSGTEGSISYTPAGSVGVTLTKGNKTITVS